MKNLSTVTNLLESNHKLHTMDIVKHKLTVFNFSEHNYNINCIFWSMWDFFMAKVFSMIDQ